MNAFIARKGKGYFCSIAALMLTVLGLIFFRMLTVVSAEQSERPVVLAAFAFAAMLFNLISSYKDYGKVPSIAAYALSTITFFTFIEGRVSYLAFYFSGDVMDTGLSPYFVIAFICLLTAMFLTLLAVIFEDDKSSSTSFDKNDLKVIIPMVAVAVILCAIVTANAVPSKAENGNKNTMVNTDNIDTGVESKYKTPTISEDIWQGYSGADYAKEDVSTKAVAYQFVGHAEIDAGEPTSYDALLNLYEDGEIVMTVYGRGAAYTYYGYWTNVDDENLWFCVAYYAMTGKPEVCTIDYSYDLTGQFDDITVNIALGFADGGQFIREMTIGGDGSVQHTTIDQWLTNLGWTAPDPAEGQPQETEAPETNANEEVLFSFTSDSENFLLDCYADGTYRFNFVTAGLEETGTWGWKDWSFTLTDANGTITSAEMDAESHALKLHFVAAMNEQVNRDFTCDATIWGAALGTTGSYEPIENIAAPTADVLFSFISDSENFLLDCYADGTYKFTFVTAGLEETGTWEWKDWSFTLTDTNGTITSAEMDAESHALKLHFVAAMNEQVNRDFTAEASVWGQAFNGVGIYTYNE